jgi:hypothetical protein
VVDSVKESIEAIQSNGVHLFGFAGSVVFEELDEKELNRI